MTVEISILGPVEAVRDGRPIDLGPPQQRALLALLAARVGTPTSVDAIIDALWPESPPATAGKIVQTYVSRLRKVLGDETVERRGSGYVLNLPPESVDARRFEALLAHGQPAEALKLWRGGAFADLASLDGLRHEAERLEEARLRALEDKLDADLAAGRYAAVAAEARPLLAAHPRRERLLGQLMTALYGAGRHAEALDVYRQARHRLVEELGLEPGPALKELERRILAHDESLLPPERPAATKAGRRPSRGLALAVLAAGAVAAAVLVGATTRFADPEAESRPVAVQPHSLVRIDPKTNRIVESIRVGRNPGGILATPDAVWVANDRDRTISRIDLRTRRVETIGGLPGVGFLTRDQRGNVYASGWDYPFVWRIDPRKVEVVGRFRVRTRAVGMAVGGGSLWVADRLVNSVVRIDLERWQAKDVVQVGADPLAVAFGYGAVWVANSDDSTVSVIRTGVDRVDTLRGSFSRPFGIATGEGGVWVGSFASSTVTRIDPDTRREVATIDVTGPARIQTGVFSLAVGAGGVWVPNRYSFDLVRIDPRTNEVAARIELPYSPNSVAVTGDSVWVAVSDKTPD